MRLKIFVVGGLILFFFLGEIAVSFSFKKESDRNVPFSEIVPLSYKIQEQQINDSNTAIIDSFVNDFVIRNKIKGASIAITKAGKLVYAKGFGWANEEDSIFVEPYHLFRIASVSKLVTAVTIMKLIEEDKLSIDDTVFGINGILNDSIYLKYSDKRIEDITIYHLLNHTAGWNKKMGDPVFNSLYIARKQKIVPPAQLSNVIEYALDQDLAFQPGKEYLYSNLGYCILGKVIEKITGMAYEDYVQFAILHPLGIYDMHIGNSFEEELFPNEVHYYEGENAGKIWAFDDSKRLVPASYGGNNIQLVGAAGGWIASAPELAKFMVAIDGFESRPDILNEKTIETMTNSEGLSRKLIGWRGSDGYGTWWRTGTMSGTSALLMRTRKDINWVMLLNTSTSKRTRIHNQMSQTMFKTLHEVKEWPDNDLFDIEPEPTENELASVD